MDEQAIRALLREEADRGSQSMVAQMFGVSEAAVSRWLAGTRWPVGPTRQKLIRWAEQRKYGATEQQGGSLAAVAEGRGIELEALLTYVLSRQQLLNEALAQLRTEATRPAQTSR